MDLVTYLKNTNNDDLYQKLKEIVKLYKEREENKKVLILLNNEYNIFLTEKHEKARKKKNTTKRRIENNLDKLEDINPLFLLWMLILLPPELLILVSIFIPLFIILKTANKRVDKIINIQEECIDMFEKLDQDTKYFRLCKARELYHAKRKELDSVLQNISKEDIELIHDFYDTLEEYENLLDHIANDLETNKQLPQVEIPKKLEQNINYEHALNN